MNQESTHLIVHLNSNDAEFRIGHLTKFEVSSVKNPPYTAILQFDDFKIKINSHSNRNLLQLKKESQKLVAQLSLDLKNEIHKSLICKHVFEHIVKHFDLTRIDLHFTDQIIPYFTLKSLSLGQTSFLSRRAFDLSIYPAMIEPNNCEDTYDQYSILIRAVSQENLKMIKELQFNSSKFDESESPAIFDVIIPTLYKNKKFLTECLESILQGSILPKQIIFVVPNALLFQKDFLDEFKSSINYIILEGSDKGVGSARQIGLLQASSEIVAFIDDDDKVEPKYFERLLAAFRFNKELDAVGCWLNSFGYSKIVLPQFDSLPIIGVINCCPPAGVLMWRRDSILSMGGFDQEFIDGYEDFDLVSRATVANKQIKVIDEPLYNYRRHKSSTSANYNFDIERNLRDLLFKKIVDFDTIKSTSRLLFVSDQTVKTVSPIYWRNERNRPTNRIRNKSLVRKFYYSLPYSIRSFVYNFLKSL